MDDNCRQGHSELYSCFWFSAYFVLDHSKLGASCCNMHVQKQCTLETTFHSDCEGAVSCICSLNLPSFIANCVADILPTCRVVGEFLDQKQNYLERLNSLSTIAWWWTHIGGLL